MIFHPGIIALISGSALVTLMMLYAAILGGKVIRHWNFQSSSSFQLSLERKTYLISTIMNYVLGFQVISALLFIYTVDDIHPLFVGAMCATGSLNVNPVGWAALAAKITVCFAAGLWIVLNYLDQRAENFPLVRLKYGLLILLLPIIGLDSFLQLRYFLGLDPDIITSCCGSLFSETGGGVASSLAGLPVRPAMIVFYGTAILVLTAALACFVSKQPLLRYLLALFNGMFLFVALAGVVSFISMYIYELPTHHCPFDIIQRGYGFIGYPLYISLFGAVFFGVLPGAFLWVKKFASLQETYIELERSWLVVSVACMVIFVGLTTYRIVISNLTYFAY